jgi:hypothetical protein
MQNYGTRRNLCRQATPSAQVVWHVLAIEIRGVPAQKAGQMQKRSFNKSQNMTHICQFLSSVAGPNNIII